MPDELAEINEVLSWEKYVPSDLLPAVKHERNQFKEADWKCRWITEILCFAVLHPDQAQAPDVSEYASQFKFLRAAINPASARLFDDLIKRNTPSSILKAFFHIYEEGLSLQVKTTFRELLEIGTANAERLNANPIEWASFQVICMIRGAAFLTGLWLKRCCDGDNAYDPNASADVNIGWSNWRAPRFARMQPSLGMPYDASRVWEREDEETSLSVLKAFKQYFVIHLESALKDCVGAAHVELAKRPKPEPQPASGVARERADHLPATRVQSAPAFMNRQGEPGAGSKTENRAQLAHAGSSEIFLPDDNYTQIGYRGQLFKLTPAAGRVVKVLHEAHKAGKEGVSSSEIKKSAGCGKVWDQFKRRDGRKFWNKVIVKGEREIFWLNLEPLADLESVSRG